MKLKDILKESSTDVVARFYKEAGKKFDTMYNAEVVTYKEKNNRYYDQHFKDWFNEEIVSVFVKPVDEPQPEYNNQPKPGKLQSAGYRGLHYALAKAGLPYNRNVQGYEPNAAQMVSTQVMDELKSVSNH